MGIAAKMVLFGSVGVIAGLSTLQAIGQIGKDEIDVTAIASESAQMATEAAATAAKASADASRASTSVSPPSRAKPSKPKPIKLADLDEADRAIRLAINQSGHLCARPTEVRLVGPDLYGVHCITYRDGTGGSNYLVNSRTNEVEEI